MPLSHTRKRPRTRPYLPRKAKGVESGATESEAVRLLAGRIPPELFENILFYVNVDRVSQRMYGHGSSLIRNRAEDILADLKQCSLVCLFWANRCRQHMFSDRTLWIQSYEDAEIFRRYVFGGCARLTPVHQLISEIEVYQDYERGRSFLHLLYLPAIQDKLKWFSINGPVPDGFNPAKLDTPHWSIPPSLVVPSSFLQIDILLANVQFPSFYHIIKYIRHFSHATFMRFDKVTWNRQMALSLPHASRTIACQRRPLSLTIQTHRVCTGAVHLALTAMMMNPNCPLHRLSDEERVWMIKVVTLMWGHEKYPDVFINFNISQQGTTMRLGSLYFVFEEATASTDRSASALSVVGMHAYICNLKQLPANLDALVNHASTQPTIRALVLLFDSFDILQETMKPFVEVLALATGTIELVLAYEMEEEFGAVGVGLATLEPNDGIDTWDDEQFEDYGGEDLSFQMLQRQLKKNRWESLH